MGVVSTGALIVSVNAFVAVPAALSVTWIVKFDVPAVVGVPVSAPVAAFSKRLAGSVPTVNAQFV